MIDWNQPVRLDLTLSDLSSLTLGLSRARDNYLKMHEKDPKKHWAGRRAEAMWELYSRLWAIEALFTSGSAVEDECLKSIEEAAGFADYSLRI